MRRSTVWLTVKRVTVKFDRILRRIAHAREENEKVLKEKMRAAFLELDRRTAELRRIATVNEARRNNNTWDVQAEFEHRYGLYEDWSDEVRRAYVISVNKEKKANKRRDEALKKEKDAKREMNNARPPQAAVHLGNSTKEPKPKRPPTQFLSKKELAKRANRA